MSNSDRFVGKYRLGYRWVRLYVDSKTPNGSVVILPDDKGSTQIFIGTDHAWEDVVSTLLHETFELSLIDLNTRYKQKPSFSQESSDFVFFMTHNQFGEACERVGDFLKHALPELTKMFQTQKKRKKA